jgi:hypothetical protein
MRGAAVFLSAVAAVVAACSAKVETAPASLPAVCTVCGVPAACVDVQHDPANCGGCGKACAAGDACVSGTCAAAACAPPYQACGGACTLATSDPANCGACGKTCTPSGPNVLVACAAGSCVDAGCAPGYGDCDGLAATGCETDLHALDDCGACGVVCAPVHVGSPLCDHATCDYDACAAGFTDCDGVRGNGCEADVATDPANCGKCGVACSAGAVCVNRACTPRAP